MTNPSSKFKQLNALTKKISDTQTEIERMETKGASGAGMVKVTVLGTGRLTKIEISPSIVDPDSIEIMEDLILAAVNDALNKRLEKVTEEMGKISKELPDPLNLRMLI